MAIMTTTTMMIVIHRKTRVHNAQPLSLFLLHSSSFRRILRFFSVCFLEYGLID